MLKKKNCTNCHYAKWETYESGYRNLDKGGECEYPEIIFPHCYFDVRRELPKKRTITKYTKPNCPLWEKWVKLNELDFGIKTVNKQLEKVNYIRKKLWEL